ncbi:Ubiquitin homeostasis protein lub1 [Schizosaccharomyces pombe]
MTSYELSRELGGHKQDVRGVCSISNELIGSASRDGTYSVWEQVNGEWTPHFYENHEGFVNCVCYVPAIDKNSRGYIFSGGQDKCGILQEVGTNSPSYYLFGHESNICSASALNSETIITGSWDSTARVWALGQCKYVLKGHQSSVWAVLALGEDIFITGSADKLIKIWNGEKLVKSILAHNDCVRSLCQIPGGFASCSNDGVVKLWTSDGEFLYELHGHTSFVYSLTYIHNQQLIASCGEDRTIRIWKGKECLQCITLPTTSVWSVSSLPNGDLVCGSSDGFVRIFTVDKVRVAPTEVLKNFEERVSQFAISSQEVGDIKKGSLPGLEILSKPGKADGDVIMVRVNNDVEAYQWSQKENEWKKIGQVVDAVGNNRKQLFEGKEYDYVFDVDVADGQAPLKLPYNATENPYQAANRFLELNQLPLSYTDEVVKFIEKNTQGHSLESKKEPNLESQSSNKIKTTIFPVSQLLFSNANVPAMCQRLRSLNNTKSNPLPAKSIDSLERALSSKKITDTEKNELLETCLSILDSWSLAERFPALDALRLLAINSSSDLAPIFLEVFSRVVKSVPSSGNFESINVMLALRGLSNVVPNITDAEGVSKLMDCLTSTVPQASSAKDFKIAFATLAMNLSILLIQLNLENTGIELLSILFSFLDDPSPDNEAFYRALMALGTLCTVPDIALAASQIYHAQSIVHGIAERFSQETRFVDAEKQILSLF